MEDMSLSIALLQIIFASCNYSHQVMVSEIQIWLLREVKDVDDNFNKFKVQANGYLIVTGGTGRATSRREIDQYPAAIVGFHEDLSDIGNGIFFRQTQDESDLQLATEYFTELFPEQTGFQATSLIICTFNRSTTFASRNLPPAEQQIRFFQMVVVDSDTVSAALFLYEEIIGLSRPVAIGVHAGDDINFGTLCVYRTDDVEFVDTTSQTECSRPGLYGFITVLATEAPPAEAADQQTEDLIRVFVLVLYASFLTIFI